MTNINRNFDKIQDESIRRVVDPKYNDVHDELSDCYYNKKEFRNYGILDKTSFDKLHGLIFLKRDVEFNSKKEEIDKVKIPLTEKTKISEKISEHENEGFVLEI